MSTTGIYFIKNNLQIFKKTGCMFLSSFLKSLFKLERRMNCL